MKTGPRYQMRKYQDQFRHERNLPYHRQKAQAVFRGETWLISFEDWCDLWTDELWAKRGKATDDYCMTRKDLDGPWSKENCIVMVRYDSLIKTKEWIMIKRKQRNGTQNLVNQES